LSDEEFNDIARELEDFHEVFYRLWAIGKPFFTDTVETAAVRFDREGKWVDFMFNPDLWEKSTPTQRKFIICHECLHIILNHGIRTQGIDPLLMEAVNAVLDIVVNHLLVRQFGFKREDLGWIGTDGCWIDTVFPKEKKLADDQAFEHYYRLLEKVSVKLMLPSLVDSHDSLGGKWSEVIDKLNETLSDEDKATIRDMIEKHFLKPPPGQLSDDDADEGSPAGTGGGGAWTFVNTGYVKKKKKWETVIKKWSRKYDNSSTRDIEQWARINRRLTLVSGSLMLPSEMEVENTIEGMIRVFFFQDTSGSCWHLKDRFFRAAKSLPKDRFDVRMFCFDDYVYDIDIDSNRICGGGGTSFDIMEHRIQQIMQTEKVPYPEAVFVITDGCGNRVKPQIPNRWYWFLSYQHTGYIPPESNIYRLSDYE
jgi:hypothetical protein